MIIGFLPANQNTHYLLCALDQIYALSLVGAKVLELAIPCTPKIATNPVSSIK